MRLLGLCGYARTGKDSCAALMPGWKCYAFADALTGLSYGSAGEFKYPAIARIPRIYACSAGLGSPPVVAWVGLGGNPITFGQFGSAIAPVGAKQAGNGYEVVWNLGGGQFIVWNTDSNGNYTSAATGILSGTSATLEAVETNFVMLWEYTGERGLRFTRPVNQPLPVTAYLQAMGRFKHLDAQQIAHIQAKVVDNLAFVKQMAQRENAV